MHGAPRRQVDVDPRPEPDQPDPLAGPDNIPRSEVGRTLEDEVKKFQDLQRNLTQKIESLKSEHTGKEKDLFAEMEKKLKEEIEKKSKPPI